MGRKGAVTSPPVSLIPARVDHALVPDIRRKRVEPVPSRLPRRGRVLLGKDRRYPALHLAHDRRPTGNEGLTHGVDERMF